MYKIILFGLLTLLLEQAFGHTNYIGCYEDSSSRLLQDYSDYSIGSSLSNTVCINRCRSLSSSYIYAGTENGGECYCSSWKQSYPQVSESECSTLCPGDNSQICGGHYRVSLYDARYQGWTAWSGFGSCSVTCGMGTQQRTRTCNDFDTSTCSGDSVTYQSCFNQICQVEFTTASNSFTTLSSHGINAVDRYYVVVEIRGSHNAYILLSAANSDSTNSYAIVIGGASNTRNSILRGGKSGTEEVFAEDSNILSTIEYRRFFVIWSDSYIKVGSVSSNVYDMKLNYSDSTFSRTYLLVSSQGSQAIDWRFIEPKNLELTTTVYHSWIPLTRYDVTVSGRSGIAFYLRGCQEGFMAISSIDYFDFSTGGYDLVVSGWGNAKSAIRLFNSDLTSTSTPSLMDCSVMRPFYFTWSGYDLIFGQMTDLPLRSYHEILRYSHSSYGRNYLLISRIGNNLDWRFVLDCGPPPPLEGATVSASSTYFQASATYTCKTGYTATGGGSATITCSDLGVWSAVQYFCAFDCGPPPNLNDSTVSAPLTYYPEKAVYTCDLGHDPLDPNGQNMELICLQSDSWENMTFICDPRDCLPPNNTIPDSEFYYTTTIFFTIDTSTVEWVCNIGYEIYPMRTEPKIECLYTGFWDTITFTCIFSLCKSYSRSYKNPASLTSRQDSLRGQMYLLNDTVYTVTCCGVVAAWEFQPLVEDFVHFFVWRRNENNNSYIVGYNTVLITDKTQLMNFSVPVGQKIAVQAYDQVGWYYEGSSPIPYGDCSGEESCPQTTLHAPGPGKVPAVGEYFEYDWDMLGTPLPNRAYSLKFYMSKNAEIDFEKGLYNASIPNHWTAGRAVMTLIVLGVDYGEDVTFEIIAHTVGTEDLFEIDKFGTVKVKGKLPVGQEEDSVYVYTVNVEDICRNNATTLMTITTYNSPPTFANLPAAIEVKEATGFNENLYYVDVYDPTNDTMCCTLEKTYPQTDNFVMGGTNESVYLYTSQRAYFSYRTVNSYLVRVCCQDKNLSRIGVLQVKVKKEVIFTEVPTPGWLMTSLVVSLVPIASLFLMSCGLLLALIFTS